MKKRVISLLLALVTALSLTTAAFAAAPWAGPAASPVPLNIADHLTYLEGNGNGVFAPDSDVTRAEAAQMLYKLLAYTVEVTVSYSDVAEDVWYRDAALELGSLGVVRPLEAEFLGNEALTRGEFIRYVAAFFPLRTDAEQFPDVDPGDENAAAILSARAYGWVEGFPNGTVCPHGTLTRAESVTILNRVLGRTGDEAVINGQRPALYLDVAPGQWFYRNVMEATIPHTHGIGADGGEIWLTWNEADTKLPAGFRTEGAHLINGWSYYYDSESKDILRNASKNGFTAGADGRFTTGDSWIDEQLRQIILAHTDPSMTREEMLRALYAYCRDNYTYLNRAHYPAGVTYFTIPSARIMLETGKGNCYCFASVFYYLSRWIGYDTQIFSGKVLRGDHSWTEINGLIYDTQLEWRYYHNYHSKYGDRYLWYFYGFTDTTDAWLYRK